MPGRVEQHKRTQVCCRPSCLHFHCCCCACPLPRRCCTAQVLQQGFCWVR